VAVKPSLEKIFPRRLIGLRSMTAVFIINYMIFLNVQWLPLELS